MAATVIVKCEMVFADLLAFEASAQTHRKTQNKMMERHLGKRVLHGIVCSTSKICLTQSTIFHKTPHQENNIQKVGKSPEYFLDISNNPLHTCYIMH